MSGQTGYLVIQDCVITLQQRPRIDGHRLQHHLPSPCQRSLAHAGESQQSRHLRHNYCEEKNCSQASHDAACIRMRCNIRLRNNSSPNPTASSKTPVTMNANDCPSRPNPNSK